MTLSAETTSARHVASKPIEVIPTGAALGAEARHVAFCDNSEWYVNPARALAAPAVARVALARKFLIAVYALLHDGVAFEEQKFAAV